MFPILAQGFGASGKKAPIRSSWLPIFLALAGAAGLHFGLPGSVPHLPPLVLLFPFSLHLLGSVALSDAQAFAHGWLTGFFGNCVCLYWMVFPLHDVAELPFFLALPCVMLLFAYFACYSGLTALGMRRLNRLFSASEQAIPRLLLPPLLGGAALAGFEVLCGNLFTGFPWLSLGTSFAFLPVWVQGASLVGGYGLSALLAASACFAAAALSPVPAKHRIASAACSAVLLLGLPAWGMARQGAEKTKEESPPFSLIMVQGNIDQSRKWEPAFQRATLARYMNLSEQALRNARSVEKLNPILLLWPETAMPFYFPRQEEHAEVLRSFAADNEIGLAFGAPAAERDENAAVPYRLYNRLYLLSPSGKTSAFYDKRHLVPFGEFIPFAADFPFLRSLLQGMDFSPGTSSAPLPLTEPAAAAEAISPSPPVLLGVLICYEAIFPSLARERVAQGANVLVNISNDGWFRRSSAPWQHLSHAVLRAVEQGRPLLRATNTGVSALIDGTGRIVSRIDGLFTADTLTVAVRPVSGTTFFHRIFPAPEIFLAALALFSLFGYKLSELIQHRNSHVPVS